MPAIERALTQMNVITDRTIYNVIGALLKTFLLLITYLELHQEGVLSERIAIGHRRAGSGSLMVAEFVIKHDLALDLGRQIFEVIIQPHDGSGEHIIRHAGIGIELLVHDNRFPIP